MAQRQRIISADSHVAVSLDVIRQRVPSALHSAFDEAIGTVLEFAEKDRNTLVIITTDHGNANPGLFYDDAANKNFDNIQNFKHTNEWVLGQIHKDDTAARVRDLISDGRPTREIREAALAEKMLEFRHSALLKVAQGLTSTEEVFRVIPSEHLLEETLV